MEETTIDLKDIIKTFKKHRKLILKVFFGFIILAAVLSFVIPPTYEAETNLRVKQPKGLANSLLENLPIGNTGATKEILNTYVQILTSRTVVEEVINKTQTEEEELPRYEDFVKKAIVALPVKDTEIVNIKVRAKSPEQAQLVANTLVNTFLERMTTLVRTEQATVREFIGVRLQESKKELEQAENALEKYKREQKIVDADMETKALLDKFAAVDKLAAENAVAQAAAQANLTSANQQLSSEKPGFVASSQLIEQYKGKLADLEVQLVGLSQKYTAKHPEVVATRAAIAETKAKLNAEIERIVTANAPSMNPIHQGILTAKIGSEAEIAASSAQKTAIDKIYKEGEQLLAQLPAKEQGLAKVLRDVSVDQEIYVMLAKRYEEARISEVMEPTDVQVIDVATLPDEPIKPKKVLNIVAAAILGLFFGTGWAFFLEHMNKSIHNADDVKRYLDLPVLGSIPDFASKHKLLDKESIWYKFKNIFNNRAERRM